jgi:hypothetical protein
MSALSASTNAPDSSTEMTSSALFGRFRSDAHQISFLTHGDVVDWLWLLWVREANAHFEWEALMQIAKSRVVLAVVAATALVIGVATGVWVHVQNLIEPSGDVRFTPMRMGDDLAFFPDPDFPEGGKGWLMIRVNGKWVQTELYPSHVKIHMLDAPPAVSGAEALSSALSAGLSPAAQETATHAGCFRTPTVSVMPQ